MNSFLAIETWGCLNWHDERVSKYVVTLDEAIREKYFIRENQLNRGLFMGDLKTAWDKIRLRVSSKQYALDDGQDEQLMRLIKFLSRSAVDLQCIQRLPMETVQKMEVKFRDGWNIHFDYDFIDAKSFFNSRQNRLNLNPHLNLLIGGALNENCRAASMFAIESKRFPGGPNQVPMLSKADAKEWIRNYSPAFKCEDLLNSLKKFI